VEANFSNFKIKKFACLLQIYIIQFCITKINYMTTEEIYAVIALYIAKELGNELYNYKY
jgi:hypothetical protein